MKLTARQERDLIISLEAKKEILPYLPDLLQDLWELGSAPAKYVDILKPLVLDPDTTKALDLGTGKGAVAIVLAQELGFHVLGVDLCEPFLEEAKKQADLKGVSFLCEFRHEDIHHTLKTARDYDLVLFISIGGLLGDFNRCVMRLRKTVSSGGYILIDDGFLKAGQSVDRPGYQHYAPHRETLEALTAHGDTLVCEVLYPDEETAAINWGYTAAIKKRAEQLKQKYPEIKESLHGYIQNQEEECRVIESSITGACWLLQRSG